MQKPDDLKPCPFCGGGEFDERESTHWTGMSSVLLSVEIRHWCSQVGGMSRKAFLVFPGKTREEAVVRWNMRLEESEGAG